MSQAQMAEIFEENTGFIMLHVKNIDEEGELDETSSTMESFVLCQEGTREIQRKIPHYHLDAVISVGYRVSYRKGTQISNLGKPATSRISCQWIRNRATAPGAEGGKSAGCSAMTKAYWKTWKDICIS